MKVKCEASQTRRGKRLASCQDFLRFGCNLSFNTRQCLQEYPYAWLPLSKRYRDGAKGRLACQGNLFPKCRKAIAKSLSRPPLLLLSPPRSSPSQCLNASANFTQASLLLKKGGKAVKQEARSSGAEAEVEDPHDFSTLEAGIKKAVDKLQEDLSKLRTGGRFNPELLESVRVQLKKDNKSTIRLGDLAQVVPKGGRIVVVLVGEANVGGELHRDMRLASMNV